MRIEYDVVGKEPNVPLLNAVTASRATVRTRDGLLALGNGSVLTRAKSRDL
jgi:hypothetical protein